MTDAPPKYIATIGPVREVTLIAYGDLADWQSRLPPCGVQVFNDQGRAELIISAVSAKWMIFPFCELTISLRISTRQDGSTRDGYYLVRAYNSSRWLAWCERTFFRTPYRLAWLNVHTEPVEVLLSDSRPLLHMVCAPRTEGVTTIEDRWEGAIYLPPVNLKGPRFERFFARLEGRTEVYAFDPARDTFESEVRWMRTLQPREWRIRRAGVHSRSKTYAVS